MTPSRRTIRIGLTGPIGCGKSTVAGWLGELGAVVIDADRVARDVTPAGSAALGLVVEAFGSDVLAPDGSLDRAALGRIVFADPVALRRLEAIIHPAVRPRIVAAMAEAEASGAPAVVVEAIKLVEGGLATLCDEVWLIACDPAVQRARLRARGQVDADERIAIQGDLSATLAPHASLVIDTSGSEATTRSAVTAAWGRLATRLGRG